MWVLEYPLNWLEPSLAFDLVDLASLARNKQNFSRSLLRQVAGDPMGLGSH